MITRKVAVAPWCAMLMGLILYATLMPPATAAISIAITNFRGDWDPTVIYSAGAFVTYNRQSYIAIVKNHNVVPIETGAWAVLDAQGLQGPQGAAGAAGAPGPAGRAGPAGAMGIPGAAGAPGPAGPGGVQGAQGTTGAPGTVGSQGPAGAQGLPGPAGAAGLGLPATCASGDVAVFYNSAWTCKSALPRYVVNGDGTLTDNQTGLMWEIQTSACAGEATCVNNQYTWSAEVSSNTSPAPADGTLFTVFIAGLNGGDYYSPSAGGIVNAAPGNVGSSGCFANHCDWRIPTIAELNSIFAVNPVCSLPGFPCIDGAFLPTQALGYWSSSQSLDDPNDAWGFRFSNVSPQPPFDAGKHDSNNYARAVRTAR
jgi:Protein of unknown function (DUF1566)/Collagen triple helix repeat (20 copies)